MRRNSRLYHDVQWDRARERFLKAHPFCLGCEAVGKQVLADVVDHIVPHFGNDLRFWDERNWQPACYWHHNSIKCSLESEWKKKDIGELSLRLDSDVAIKLTLRRFKPQIGLDGWPVEIDGGESKKF